MGDTILDWSDLSFLSTIRYPDCRIRRGEVVFVSGQSGSGKSSLFRLINATASCLLENLLTHARETGMTLLIISHDSALRARFADTVIPLGGLS